MTGPVGMGASAAAGLAATNDAMQGIISAANNGSFRVTPDAGNELIKIFQDFEAFALAEMLGELATLKQQTPLGDSPAGQAIAQFNSEVAAGGDGRSYEDLLEDMQRRVPEVIEAIRKGIRLYQEVDEGNANFGVQV